MAYARKKLSEDETRKLFKDGRKKFVTVEEGAQLFSIGIHRFRDIAEEAKAVYHVGKTVLINVEIVDEFMEVFRDL